MFGVAFRLGVPYVEHDIAEFQESRSGVFLRSEDEISHVEDAI